MKITIFLLLISVFQVFATENYAQKTELNLDLGETTVAQVLEKIEQESEFYFLFNQKLVDVDRKVNLNVKQEKINDILARVFKGTGTDYVVIDRQIVLSPGEYLAGIKAQQPIEVSGTVTDAQTGEPLPGVNIVVQGTTTGTTTDMDGEYSIEAPPDATLVFSFVGYQEKSVSIESREEINIALQQAVTELEEVVAVGYGVQERASITGSISAVDETELTVAPVASSSNALTGRLPGLISFQQEGRPGADQASLNIRGFGNPLVIIDGVEGDINDLNPSTIESVSILKDGAASIYGSRAGNGVILVTTKRGSDSKPTFTLNSTFTGQGVTHMPDKASSGQWAEMERERWIQSGKPEETAPWTEEDIQKFYDGSDPVNYPNTDWEEILIRDWAPQQQHNLSMRGGSERIKYYGFLGYTDQETMWKKSGGEYTRYNLQSNVDMKILDNLDLQLNLRGNKEVSAFPYRWQSIASNGTWFDYYKQKPWTLPRGSLPDPDRIPWQQAGGSPILVASNRDLGGRRDNISQELNGSINLNYRFNNIKGLSAKMFINYRKIDNYNEVFQKGWKEWSYDPGTDTYEVESDQSGNTRMDISHSNNREITGQFNLNYDRTFNEVHHLEALAIYEAIDYRSQNFSAGRGGYRTTAIQQLYAGGSGTMTNSGSESEMGRTSYIGRLNYSYKEKYLLETIFRADASAKFPPTRRWGFFPSASIGWRISEENFMATGIVDNLKLRASYGESGVDNVLNFQYLAGYEYGQGSNQTYLFGPANSPSTYAALKPGSLPNPNLTWEEITLYNAGVDFSLWNRRLYGEADVFYRERDGIHATQLEALPPSFGADLPPENINSQSDRGFELKIGTAKRGSDLTWDISGNISLSRAKWIHFEEPEFEDPDQARIEKRSGRWTDVRFGYVSDGLFTSQEEIDNLGFDQDLQGNTTLKPGDIRYVDVNEDGKLDWRDRVKIGKGTRPNWMFGFNTVLTYKNFDFSALWQGAFGYYKNVNIPNNTEEYYNLRWTKENNDPNALVPRLGGAPTNGLFSDYRFRNASYLRLKQASIGYSLPQSLLSTIGLTNFRIYAAGTNLLTFSKLKDYGIDPEAPSGSSAMYYPQQRTITLGAKVSF